MAETIFDRINATIATLDQQLNEAEAVILDRQGIFGKYKFNKLMAAKARPISNALSARKDMYDSRIPVEEYTQFLDTLEKIPHVLEKLESINKKTTGWKINIGQLLAAMIRQLYALLKSDVMRNPELKPFLDSVSECFPQPGARKPKDNGDTDSGTGNPEAK